jgi:hypothetical protein
VTVFGEDKPAVRNILTLGSCAPIPGAEVMSFDREEDLLKRWTALVLETDPDVIIGARGPFWGGGMGWLVSVFVFVLIGHVQKQTPLTNTNQTTKPT